MLTFEPALIEALQSADFCPIWLVEVIYTADGTVSKKFVSGDIERFGADPSIARVELQGTSLDPVKRITQVTTSAEIILVNDGSAEFEFENLIDSKVVIYLGASSLTLEADYAKLYSGICVDVVYNRSGHVSIILGSYQEEFKRSLAIRVYSSHPADMLAALIRATPGYEDFELPEDAKTGTEHWRTAMPVRGDGDWSEENSPEAADAADPIEWSIDDLLFITGGSLRLDPETDLPEFVPYNQTAPAALTLTTADYYPESVNHLGNAAFRYYECGTDLNLATAGVPTRHRGTTALLVLLASDPDNSRARQPEGRLVWDCALLRNRCTAHGSSIDVTPGGLKTNWLFTEGASYAGFCYSGATLAPNSASWYPADEGQDPIVVGKEPIWLIYRNMTEIEVVKPDIVYHTTQYVTDPQTYPILGKTYVYYQEGHEGRFTFQSSDFTVYDLTGWLEASVPRYLRWRVPESAQHRGLLGTGAGNCYTPLYAVDLTIIHHVCTRVVARHKDGLCHLRVTAKPEFCKIQQGDIISIEIPWLKNRYALSSQGLTADTTFEVVQATVRLGSDPPGVDLELVEMNSAYNRDDNPTYTLIGEEVPVQGEEIYEAAYYGNRYWGDSA